MRDWDEYAQAWAALHGGVDPRRARPEIRRFLRVAYQVGRVLARLRVPPAAVTGAALLLSLAVPVLAARHGGWPALAAVLVLASGFADSLDGAVAVIASRTSPLGYVADSVGDRLSELSWLVAIWLLGVPAWLAGCVLAGAWLHEYVRARAVGAGMTEIGTVTVAERPTRVAFAFATLMLAAIGTLINSGVSVWGAILVTGAWALVGLVGLVQLLVAVVRGLTGTLPPAPAAGPGPDPAYPAPAAPPAAQPPSATQAPAATHALSGEAPTLDLRPGEGSTLRLPADRRPPY